MSISLIKLTKKRKAMRKALFIIAALLTSACAETKNEEPLVVYRGAEDQGCNYYNGICYRADRKFVANSVQQQNPAPVAQDYTTTVKSGEYKHCSNTIFGSNVPAPKIISSGPKVVQQTAPTQYVQQQPVQYVQQPVQYIQQPVQYLAQATTQPAICTTGSANCQPIVTQTREPVEVVYKKTTTTTVFEPKTTQEVAFEKEAYNGQIPCTTANCGATTVNTVSASAPVATITTVATPAVPAPAPNTYSQPSPSMIFPQPNIKNLVPVRRAMPSSEVITEINMDPMDVK